MFDVPVKSGRRRPVDGLLAGDPAAPRHRAAGAVHLGAVEAGVGVDDLAVAGHLDRGRAALGHGVVRLGGVAEGRARVVDLVVADERDVAPRPPAAERGHAVVAAGQHGPVVERHRGLGVVEAPVREPRGEVEAHDAVAGVGHRRQHGSGRPAAARRGTGPGQEAGEGPAPVPVSVAEAVPAAAPARKVRRSSPGMAVPLVSGARAPDPRQEQANDALHRGESAAGLGGRQPRRRAITGARPSASRRRP